MDESKVRDIVREVVRAELPRIVRAELRAMIAEQAEREERPDETPLGVRRREWLPDGGFRFRTVAARTPVDWAEARRTCAKCGHTGPVLPDFGLRMRKYGPASNSWCRACKCRYEAQRRAAG
jgi:hypothetical protein